MVLMTAYAADDLIQQGLEAGVVGVLDKPINIVQLLGFFSTLAKNRTLAIVDDDPEFCKTLGISSASVDLLWINCQLQLQIWTKWHRKPR